MKTIYFSATGNSLYVAKNIGGELCSIKSLLADNSDTITDDVIGIVFPVFWLSVPAYVRDFLSNTTFECDYLYGIMTYGDNMFGAIHDLNTIRIHNNRHFDYIRAIKMTENYLPMYDMNVEIAKAANYPINKEIQDITVAIHNRTRLIPKVSWFGRLLTTNFKKKHCMSIDEGEAAYFTISSDCIGCGQCVSICPMQNIKLEDGKPTFIGKCADCLGCIQNCPKKAIHTPKEKNGERYRNPNIYANELLN